MNTVIKHEEHHHHEINDGDAIKFNNKKTHDHGCGCDSCACGHDHSRSGDDGTMKKRLITIIVAAVLFAVVFVIDHVVELASVFPGTYNWVLPFVCYFIVYLILGKDILKEAFEGIIHGELLDENFLMSIASLGAFALGIYKGFIGEDPDGFEEGCAVVIFYSIGEWFQSWALGRSRKSIADLMDIRPDVAHVIEGDGIRDVAPSDVAVGTKLLIKKGEKTPVDGILLSDVTVLDTMTLTGESEHEHLKKGDEVLSGSINMGEDIEIETARVYEDSTVARILDLVENSPENKARAETFITRFARIYTPIVVGLAVAIAILPPLFGLVTGLNAASDLSWTTWIYRALSFLVVSCPCALVISIPLSFFMGIGTASRYHILIKGSNCLELISKANIFVSDKTGTLTIGREIKPEARSVVAWIKKIGARLFVLSGDKKEIVENVATDLGIEHYHSELKPDEKVNELEEILKNKGENDVVVYMGDGINDAPSLIRADVGISMGNIGSDAAVEASNIVLMKDNLYGVPLIKKIANRTMTIVRENIIFSIGIKVVVLILSAFGITNMWVAVFADVGVALLAVLNALRVGAVKYDENVLNE